MSIYISLIIMILLLMHSGKFDDVGLSIVDEHWIM